jgi:hypothetical protein
VISNALSKLSDTTFKAPVGSSSLKLLTAPSTFFMLRKVVLSVRLFKRESGSSGNGFWLELLPCWATIVKELGAGLPGVDIPEGGTREGVQEKLLGATRRSLAFFTLALSDFMICKVGGERMGMY